MVDWLISPFVIYLLQINPHSVFPYLTLWLPLACSVSSLGYHLIVLSKTTGHIFAVSYNKKLYLFELIKSMELCFRKKSVFKYCFNIMLI